MIRDLTASEILEASRSIEHQAKLPSGPDLYFSHEKVSGTYQERNFAEMVEYDSKHVLKMLNSTSPLDDKNSRNNNCETLLQTSSGRVLTGEVPTVVGTAVSLLKSPHSSSHVKLASAVRLNLGH